MGKTTTEQCSVFSYTTNINIIFVSDKQCPKRFTNLNIQLQCEERLNSVSYIVMMSTMQPVARSSPKDICHGSSSSSPAPLYCSPVSWSHYLLIIFFIYHVHKHMKKKTGNINIIWHHCMYGYHMCKSFIIQNIVWSDSSQMYNLF